MRIFLLLISNNGVRTLQLVLDSLNFLNLNQVGLQKTLNQRNSKSKTNNGAIMKSLKSHPEILHGAKIHQHKNKNNQ